VDFQTAATASAAEPAAPTASAVATSSGAVVAIVAPSEAVPGLSVDPAPAATAPADPPVLDREAEAEDSGAAVAAAGDQRTRRRKITGVGP